MRSTLKDIRELSRLLGNMEWSGTFDADEYRSLAQSLINLLEVTRFGKKLDRVLTECPIASELYENLWYAHAGLCRSPLEIVAPAELVAQTIIERIRRVHSKK